MKTVLNKRYDLSGIELLRTFKLAALGKIVPLGNWRGGPGLRCLMVLALLHYLGNPLYRLKARYGHQLGAIRRIANRLRK